MNQPNTKRSPEQIAKQPPKLPQHQSNVKVRLYASRYQRIRAGLVDHFIDSTVWVWLFVMTIWTSLHLQTPIDSRAFFIILCSNFSISLGLTGLMIIGDFLLCVYRGQSLGQIMNGIYKTDNSTDSSKIKNHTVVVVRMWIHGLVSRCLGLPLLFVCLMLWLSIDPIIEPIQLQKFSLIEPNGSYLLMTFLLKIIGVILFLFGLFLPAGIAFAKGTIPTWYDLFLGINIQSNKQLHNDEQSF
jgi:hypothetical protein